MDNRALAVDNNHPLLVRSLQPTCGIGMVEGAFGQNGMKPENTLGHEGQRARSHAVRTSPGSC